MLNIYRELKWMWTQLGGGLRIFAVMIGMKLQSMFYRVVNAWNEESFGQFICTNWANER